MTNVGTGPELVVCGYFLARGYADGRDLFFQEDKFVIDDVTRTSRKEFVVDVAVSSQWGGTTYLNIDGVYFHTRTELQEFHDHLRDRSEQRWGKVVDVPDAVTLDPESLVDFLGRNGVIAA